MIGAASLARDVQAGDTLKPWIILGPFNHDMSDKVVGLSYFEDSHSQVGRGAMAQIAEEALAVLALAPMEGELMLANAAASGNPASGFCLQVELVAADGAVLKTARPTTAGDVVLAEGRDLADGVYHLRCAWLRGGQAFTSTAFTNLHKVTPVAAPQGYERFDERRLLVLQHYWVFVRVQRGYVGSYSQHGMQLGDYGQYAGRELQCWSPDNTWLVECGREGDWPSFEAFAKGLSAAPVTSDRGVITYESPTLGRFVTGWDVAPTLNGTPIALTCYPLVDSAWAHSAFGSGELTLRYGDAVYELWLNQ